MVVAYELIRGLLEFVANLVGLNGIAIGTTAGALVGLYYVRELSGVFVLLARYARVLSIVGFALLIVLVGGSALGIVEISNFSDLVGMVTDQFHMVIKR